MHQPSTPMHPDRPGKVPELTACAGSDIRKGLAQTTLAEIRLWLQHHPVDIVVLTETRWSFSSTWSDKAWMYVHSASADYKSGGVLIMISRRLACPEQIGRQAIVEGRLVHVRVHFDSRALDILAIYQHVDNRNKISAQQREQARLQGILKLHGLTAINTWGASGLPDFRRPRHGTTYDSKLWKQFMRTTRPYPQHGIIAADTKCSSAHNRRPSDRSVREMVAAHRRTTKNQIANQAKLTICGGLSLFLDLNRAFDSADRRAIFEHLIQLGTPPNLVQLAASWHEDTHYNLSFRGATTSVPVGKGLRQGCKLAPLLWVSFMDLLLRQVAQITGYQWVHDCLTIYADDVHVGCLYRSKHELHTHLVNIGHTLDVIENMKLSLSYSKSHMLIAYAGTNARVALKGVLQRTPTGASIRVPRLGREHTCLPLRSKGSYLGVCISYHAFELQTWNHRKQASWLAFARLRAWLRSRQLTRAHRMYLWKTCVFTVLTYGLLATNVTIPVLLDFQGTVYKMVRTVLQDHSYITHTTHQAAFQQHRIDPPLEMLRALAMGLLQRIQRHVSNVLTATLPQIPFPICAVPPMMPTSPTDVRLTPMPARDHVYRHFQVSTQPFWPELERCLHNDDWPTLCQLSVGLEHLTHHCAICGTWCNRFQELHSHYRLYHDEQLKGGVVKGAQLTHVMQLVSPCALCAKQYSRVHSCPVTFQLGILRLQLQEPDIRAQQELTCEICVQQFDDQGQLYQHMARDHNHTLNDWVPSRDSVQGSDQCRHCSMQFDSRSGLRRHITEGRCDAFDPLASHNPMDNTHKWSAWLHKGDFSPNGLSAHQRLQLTTTCQFCEAKYMRTGDVVAHLLQSHGPLWNSSQSMLRYLLQVVMASRGCICNPQAHEVGLAHICTPLRQVAMMMVNSDVQLLVPTQFHVDTLAPMLTPLRDEALTQQMIASLVSRDFAKLWTDATVVQALLPSNCMTCCQSCSRKIFSARCANKFTICLQLTMISSYNKECKSNGVILSQAARWSSSLPLCYSLFMDALMDPNDQALMEGLAALGPLLLGSRKQQEGSVEEQHPKRHKAKARDDQEHDGLNKEAITTLLRLMGQLLLSHERSIQLNQRQDCFVLFCQNRPEGIIPHLATLASKWREDLPQQKDNMRWPNLRTYLMKGVITELHRRVQQLASSKPGDQQRHHSPGRELELPEVVTRAEAADQGLPQPSGHGTDASESPDLGGALPEQRTRGAVPEPQEHPEQPGSNPVDLTDLTSRSRSLGTHGGALPQHSVVVARNVGQTAFPGALETGLAPSTSHGQRPQPPGEEPRPRERQDLSEPLEAAARQSLRDRALQLAMANPGNDCYANSAFVSMIWATLSRSAFTFQDWGARSAILQQTLEHADGTLFSLENASWFQHLIEGWNEDGEQADSAEFTHMLSSWTAMSAISNCWERRVQTEQSTVLHDAGDKFMPLTLQFDPQLVDHHEIQLSALLRTWHTELGMLAGLTDPEDLLLLHVDRMTHAPDGTVAKCQAALRFGWEVQIPVLGSHTCTWMPYTVIACIAHLGGAQNGHYQAILRTYPEVSDLARYHMPLDVPDEQGRPPQTDARPYEMGLIAILALFHCGILLSRLQTDRNSVGTPSWEHKAYAVINRLDVPQQTDSYCSTSLAQLDAGPTMDFFHKRMLHFNLLHAVGPATTLQPFPQPGTDAIVLLPDLLLQWEHTKSPHEQLWLFSDLICRVVPASEQLYMDLQDAMEFQLSPQPLPESYNSSFLQWTQWTYADLFCRVVPVLQYFTDLFCGVVPETILQFEMRRMTGQITTFMVPTMQLLVDATDLIDSNWHALHSGTSEDAADGVLVLFNARSIQASQIGFSGFTYFQRQRCRLDWRTGAPQWDHMLQATGHLLQDLCSQPTPPTDPVQVFHETLGPCFHEFYPQKHRAPKSAQDHHAALIQEKWFYHRQVMQTRALTLQALFHVWKCRSRYAALNRTHKQHTKLLKQQRFYDLLSSVQQAAQHHDSFAVHQIISQYTPKQPKRRIQLRNAVGAPATPHEGLLITKEFVESTWAGPSHVDLGDRAPPGVPFTIQDLEHELHRLPHNRSVAKPFLPAIVVKMHASTIASWLHHLLTHWWSTETPFIPAQWKRAWVTFIPKPNKSPSQVSNLRCIALQEPLGKCVLGALTKKLQLAVGPTLQQWPQYAFLPLRSTGDAIRRVAAHCNEVRSLVKNQRRSAHQRAANVEFFSCCGGIQIFLDIQRAFDQLPRQALFEHLDTLHDQSELTTLMAHWHSQTDYCIEHSGETALVSTGCGVRQGCRAAPLLWNSFLDQMFRTLAQQISPEWVKQTLTAFADDIHQGTVFRSSQQLQLEMTRIGLLLDTLENMGLTLSLEKSCILLEIAGSHCRKIRNRLLKYEGSHAFIDIPRANGRTSRIPVKRTADYLGTCLSYGNYEQQTFDKRVHCARLTFHRLRRWLCTSQIALRHRLLLWKACVLSTLMYGIVVQTNVSPADDSLLEVRSCDKNMNLDALLREEEEQRILRMHQSLTAALHTKPYGDALLQLVTNHDWNGLADLRPACEALSTQCCVCPPEVPPAAALRCEVCGLRAEHIDDLHKHLASVHRLAFNDWQPERDLMGKDPACSHCSKCFTNVSAVRQHVTLGQCSEFDPHRSPFLLPIAEIWTTALATGDLQPVLSDPMLRMRMTLHCAQCGAAYMRSGDLILHLQTAHSAMWGQAQALTRYLMKTLMPQHSCVCNPSVHKVTLTHVCPFYRQMAMLAGRSAVPLFLPWQSDRESLALSLHHSQTHAVMDRLVKCIHTRQLRQLLQDNALQAFLREHCVICGGIFHPALLRDHILQVHSSNLDRVVDLLPLLFDEFQRASHTDYQCAQCHQIFNLPMLGASNLAEQQSRQTLVLAHFQQCPVVHQVSLLLTHGLCRDSVHARQGDAGASGNICGNGPTAVEGHTEGKRRRTGFQEGQNSAQADRRGSTSGPPTSGLADGQIAHPDGRRSESSEKTRLLRLLHANGGGIGDPHTEQAGQAVAPRDDPAGRPDENTGVEAIESDADADDGRDPPDAPPQTVLLQAVGSTVSDSNAPQSGERQGRVLLPEMGCLQPEIGANQPSTSGHGQDETLRGSAGGDPSGPGQCGEIPRLEGVRGSEGHSLDSPSGSSLRRTSDSFGTADGMQGMEPLGGHPQGPFSSAEQPGGTPEVPDRQREERWEGQSSSPMMPMSDEHRHALLLAIGTLALLNAGNPFGLW
ncbi:unnamed protein product [Cladocopium goreaui]|uniref:LINE-1 retrotransposable element ORF2 protein (ORF2p) (Long interspersed element-1) (L1) (Retrovirus-related Pol polyprotein LINE-1) n=1 Tax=Cladocopium goreaui TaxID=2562237 RepID=A0A9P1FTP6_9DINO|nr:unnamed protein product [Cladocopium goreaui]